MTTPAPRRARLRQQADSKAASSAPLQQPDDNTCKRQVSRFYLTYGLDVPAVPEVLRLAYAQINLDQSCASWVCQDQAAKLFRSATLVKLYTIAIVGVHATSEVYLEADASEMLDLNQRVQYSFPKKPDLPVAEVFTENQSRPWDDPVLRHVPVMLDNKVRQLLPDITIESVNSSVKMQSDADGKNMHFLVPVASHYGLAISMLNEEIASDQPRGYWGRDECFLLDPEQHQAMLDGVLIALDANVRIMDPKKIAFKAGSHKDKNWELSMRVAFVYSDAGRRSA